MKLWTLVVVLALGAALCAGAALLVAQRAGVDPYLVANAAMFAVMAVYVARRASSASHRPEAPSCRRCGAVASPLDPPVGFCIRCGHIPRHARGLA